MRIQLDHDKMKAGLLITVAIVCSIALFMMIATVALASGSHHNDTVTNVYNTYDAYVTNVTEEQRITDLVNTTNISNYTQDHCQGVAIASAGANNHMSLATNKAQISLGMGECGGEVAGSLMLGVKAGKNALINGSYARDEDIDSFGIGFTVILK